MSRKDAFTENVIAWLRNQLIFQDDDSSWGLAVELKSEITFLKPYLDRLWYKKIKSYHKKPKQASTQLILRYRDDSFYICVECYPKKSSNEVYPDHIVSLNLLRYLVGYLRNKGYTFYDQSGKFISFE